MSLGDDGSADVGGEFVDERDEGPDAAFDAFIADRTPADALEAAADAKAEAEAGDAGMATCPDADLMNDPANCGSCDHTCGGDGGCSAGLCMDYRITVSAQTFPDACTLSGFIRVLTNKDDDATSLANLPLPFLFYGKPATQYWVNSNGVMGLGGTPSNAPNTSCPLPNAGNPRPAIYAFSDDLQTRSGGICIATRGAPPYRQMVVTWVDANLNNNATGHLTFSIVLSETSNTIDLFFQTMTGTAGAAQGSQATIGIEDDTGARAAQFSCQRASVMAPSDVRFTPSP
jgi:hypothetical protein